MKSKKKKCPGSHFDSCGSHCSYWRLGDPNRCTWKEKRKEHIKPKTLWEKCERVGCPVSYDDLEARKYPGLCSRCSYYSYKKESYTETENMEDDDIMILFCELGKHGMIQGTGTTEGEFVYLGDLETILKTMKEPTEVKESGKKEWNELHEAVRLMIEELDNLEEEEKYLDSPGGQDSFFRMAERLRGAYERAVKDPTSNKQETDTVTQERKDYREALDIFKEYIAQCTDVGDCPIVLDLFKQLQEVSEDALDGKRRITRVLEMLDWNKDSPEPITDREFVIIDMLTTEKEPIKSIKKEETGECVDCKHFSMTETSIGDAPTCDHPDPNADDLTCFESIKKESNDVKEAIRGDE